MLYKASFLNCQKNVMKNIVFCHICTTSVLQSKATVNFSRKFLLQSKGKKRRKWHDNRKAADHDLNFVKPEGKEVNNTKRIKILSNVFLKKIAEIMSTGEISAQLCGLSLEISEVRVLPNLQGINVHWLCPGTDDDAKIETVLLRNSKSLRHELSQLRVLGHIPPITFVKDQRFWRIQEVERLLSVADFGEDFKTSDPTHELKSSHVLNTTVKYNNDKESINKVKIEGDDPFVELFKSSVCDLLSNDGGTDKLPPDLPPMRCDVLGVDTKDIYTKVLQRLKKTRADHRKNIEKQTCSSPSLWDADTCSFSSKSKEIQHWVSQYKLQHKKVSLQNKKEAMLNISPHHYVEDEEEIVYSEEEDYIQE